MHCIINLAAAGVALLLSAASLSAQALTVTDADLARSFDGWWLMQQSPSQYEERFVAHRELLVARYGWLPGIEQLDLVMWHYPAPVPAWRAQDHAPREALLTSLAELHSKRQLIAGFLPYLIALHQADAADLRTCYFLAEGWLEMGQKSLLSARQAFEAMVAACKGADPKAISGCVGDLSAWGGEAQAVELFLSAAQGVQGKLAAGQVPRAMAVKEERHANLLHMLQEAMSVRNSGEARHAFDLLCALDPMDLAASWLQSSIGSRGQPWRLPQNIAAAMQNDAGRRAVASGVRAYGFAKTADAMEANSDKFREVAGTERDAFMKDVPFRLPANRDTANAVDLRGKWVYVDPANGAKGSFTRLADGTWREEADDGRRYEFREELRDLEHVLLKCTTDGHRHKLVKLFDTGGQIKLGKGSWGPLFPDGKWN